MGWGRIDDALYTHRKWVGLSWASRGVWTTLVSWCCQQSNSGRFTLVDVGYLTGEDLSRAISELRFKGWIDEITATDGAISYQLHDFLFWNPGANQVDEARTAEARSRRAREAGRASQKGKTTKMPGCPDCERQPRACYAHSTKKLKRDAARNGGGTVSPTPVLRESYVSPPPLEDTSPNPAFHKGEATSSQSHPTPSVPKSGSGTVAGEIKTEIQTSPQIQNGTAAEPTKKNKTEPPAPNPEIIKTAAKDLFDSWPHNERSKERINTVQELFLRLCRTEDQIATYKAAAWQYQNEIPTWTSEMADKTYSMQKFFSSEWYRFLPRDFDEQNPTAWMPPTARQTVRIDYTTTPDQTPIELPEI